ncbi:alpha-hydroxy-acid oxidizing protein [Paenalcaligenes niemegkensis]|uniref:alpha-hydroxy acid oxidase n=1 Tax=Paenalcaligenes niemegkensis TaxID=2895469 RepID=UPI001EE899D8|nr:alpha-hydroxy acid oxidase [Paenalcaligenes niemegkensis]MCQ9617422.1 alpha-hydroxy-acid oxidizing protein [Paenalcaligenes niemegkensis]
MALTLEPLQQIPSDIVCVDDYIPYAKERLTAQAWAFFSGGAADEFAIQRNRQAFNQFQLVPAVLNKLSGGHTRSRLLDQEMAYPILLAPIAYQQLAHRNGELATVLAASAMQATMVLSMQSSVALHEVAHQAHGPLWFQWYKQADREASIRLLNDVESAGYEAIVLTVDAPVNGIRNREQRAQFVLPIGVSAVNLSAFKSMSVAPGAAGTSPVFGSGLVEHAATWEDVERIVAATHLPVLLKGILRATDARRAMALGVKGLVVSNHGGRTLDAAISPLDALAAVVDEVGGRMPVLFDGGIHRGTDIFIALALGASAVLIGRPYIYGLAAAGAPGVAHVLHILRTELEVAMALCGCATLADINRDFLYRK